MRQALTMRGGTATALLFLSGVWLGALAAPATADSDLLVSSNSSSSVERFDLATRASLGSFVPSGSGGLTSPDGMVFGPDGNLYVCNERASSVLRYDGKTGAFLDTFVPSGSGGLDIAEYPAFGPDGNLYVASLRAHSVLRYDGRTGAFKDAFVPPHTGGLTTPSGMLFGPDGNLYVSSTDTHEVLRYDGKTGAFKDVFVTARSGGLNGPYGLGFGPDGILYVVSISSAQVLRYSGTDGAFLGPLVTGLPLVFPTYLAFTPTPETASCQEDATHLCLEGGRFRVEVTWSTPNGGSGSGQGIRLTADSGYFWFFSAANVELLVKVLDGCALGGHHWVFAGGLTNVATTLTVTDTQTGAVKTYRNPQGTAFAPLEDTAAFSSCP